MEFDDVNFCGILWKKAGFGMETNTEKEESGVGWGGG